MRKSVQIKAWIWSAAFVLWMTALILLGTMAYAMHAGANEECSGILLWVKQNMIDSGNGYVVFWSCASSAIAIAIPGTCTAMILKERNRRRRLERTLDDISRGPDDEIIRLLKEGQQPIIAVTDEGMTVNPYVMKYCSVGCLADIMTDWLRIVYDKMGDDDDIFHSTIDCFFAHWEAEMVKDFIIQVGRRKEYLGLRLEAAYSCRHIDDQLLQLRKDMHSLEQEKTTVMERSKQAVKAYEQRLEQSKNVCGRLLEGGSRAKEWLSRLRQALSGRKAIVAG